MNLTETDITTLVRKTLGQTSGRVRLHPETPEVFDVRREVRDVGPEQAMEWLAQTWERYSNGRNFYPTRLEKIQRYSRVMTAGGWQYDPDGDPITLTDGIITGGRHRLHAILLSHTTQRFNVQHKTRKE